MQDFFSLKSKVHDTCCSLVEERIAHIKQTIGEMREAAQDNSKSSAGDKHETGRAMTDLEIEKQQLSLHHLLSMQAVLKQLDPLQQREKVTAGSLIETKEGWFYIAVGLGKIHTGEQEIIVISADAPIVKAFHQYPTEKKISFNGKHYHFLQVG